MAYYCTATDVIDRLSDRGVQLRLDDRPQAISSVLRRATNKVKAFLLPLYASSDLQANSDAQGEVNDLAADLAVAYLCERRGNTKSASVKEAFDRAMADLEDYRQDLKQVADLNQQHISSPAFSNVRVDTNYTYRKIRVESPISEPTAPVGYVPAVDWWSLRFVEYLWWITIGILAVTPVVY